MANFSFGYNFVSGTDATSSVDSAYPLSNIAVYDHLKWQWRSLVSTQVTITRDFGTAQTLNAVMLNDVNFASVYIEGSANNSTWPFSQSFTVSKDERVQRYKLYAALTGFNYRYLRIRMPAQTPTDGLTVFRMGTLVCLNTVLTMSENPDYPYDYSADEKMKTTEFESGGYEDINLGDIYWEGSFGFKTYAQTNEADFWTLNSLKKNAFLVFYENNADTSKAYLCKRRTAISVSWTLPQYSDIQTLKFREAI